MKENRMSRYRLTKICPLFMKKQSTGKKKNFLNKLGQLHKHMKTKYILSSALHSHTVYKNKC